MIGSSINLGSKLRAGVTAPSALSSQSRLPGTFSSPTGYTVSAPCESKCSRKKFL